VWSRKPPPPPQHHLIQPIDNKGVLLERRLTFPFYLVDPLKRKKPIEDGRNPMLVRELRWGLLDRADSLIRMFYMAFLVYLSIGGFGFLTGGWSQAGSEWYICRWLTLQMLGTVVVAPALLATTLTREYETGNMDMLRTTLMTPREIIVGKLCGGLAAASPLLLAAVGSCLPLLYALRNELAIVVSGYITLFVCVGLCLALALFASLLTTHSTNALVLTYLFTLLVFLGPSGLFMMLPAKVAGYLYWLGSPPTVFAYLIATPEKGSFSRVLWLGNTALFAGFALALVVATVYGFARYRLRDE
jgi:ABC-type transport system involved in multi-copper enzyme maturation permease subunit